MAVDWWWSARPIAALGFDIPISPRGEIGLAIAAVLVVALVVSAWISSRRPTAEKRAKYEKQLESNDLLPQTAAEFWAFAFVSLAVGVGWEVLYRGFLLWSLVPYVGTLGAIFVAAMAYGLAHGYKSHGQIIGSIISAFAFTVAFAVTHSLWWLMILHIRMALLGGLISYRVMGEKNKWGPNDAGLVSP